MKTLVIGAEGTVGRRFAPGVDNQLNPINKGGFQHVTRLVYL